MTQPPFLLTEDDIQLHDIEGHDGIWIPSNYDLESPDTETQADMMKQQIMSALKLQRLVEDTIKEDNHDEPFSMCMREILDPCYICDEREILQKLLEESK